ncbi:cyclin-like protein [Chytriomyces sp. MP71]|nr:cyclin-like protein [Chytriomyces sp. MP71]
MFFSCQIHYPYKFAMTQDKVEGHSWDLFRGRVGEKEKGVEVSPTRTKPPMPLVCHCGSSQVEYESNLGVSVCVSCGEVLEENAIVAEVTFTETGGGAAMADGFFVSKNSARAFSRGGPSGMGRLAAGGGTSTESREQTIANGHRRIAQIGHQMRMTDRQIEQAQRYFNLAVLKNFTKGRKAANVACACLYIICRMEKTSHMLIDFSEHLRINLYILGSTFVRLVHILNINDIPLVDPMLYIVRFATKLEFEDKVNDVIRDATRLVSRMDRDWIIKGRKPAGICAACLFIAARMNGFVRTATEIVETVKICETTLRKRLADFKETPSSALSVDDFQNLMLESSQDPPSFMRKRKTRPIASDEDEDGDGQRFVAMEVKGKEKETEKMERYGAPPNESKGVARARNRSGSPDAVARTKKVLKGKGIAVQGQPDAEAEAEEEVTSGDMNDALQSEELRDLAKSVGVDMDNLDEDLSFLDDDAEVNACLLTEVESEIKSYFWQAANGDWERQKMHKDEAQANKPAGPKRTRKKNRQLAPGPVQPMANALEASQNIVSSRPMLSNKFNYDALSTLFDDEENATTSVQIEPARPGGYASGSVTGFGSVGFD